MTIQHAPYTSHVHPIRRLRRYLRGQLWWNRLPAKSSIALSATVMLLGVSAAAVAASQVGNIASPHNQSSLSNEVGTDSQSNTIESDDAQPEPDATQHNITQNNGSVTVDGQTFSAPENGSLQQTITGPDGSTTQVNIQNFQSTTTSDGNTSTTRSSTNTTHNSGSSSTSSYSQHTTEFHSGP